jgi:hypothetical protein
VKTSIDESGAVNIYLDRSICGTERVAFTVFVDRTTNGLVDGAVLQSEILTLSAPEQDEAYAAAFAEAVRIRAAVQAFRGKVMADMSLAWIAAHPRNRVISVSSPHAMLKHEDLGATAA